MLALLLLSTIVLATASENTTTPHTTAPPDHTNYVAITAAVIIAIALAASLGVSIYCCRQRRYCCWRQTYQNI